jgi:hypothetical protein
MCRGAGVTDPDGASSADGDPDGPALMIVDDLIRSAS